MSAPLQAMDLHRHVLLYSANLMKQLGSLRFIQISALQRSKTCSIARISACIGMILWHVFKYASMPSLQLTIKMNVPGKHGMTLETQAAHAMGHQIHQEPTWISSHRLLSACHFEELEILTLHATGHQRVSLSVKHDPVSWSIIAP